MVMKTIQKMLHPLRHFLVRRSERWFAALIGALIAAVNAMLICAYYDALTPIRDTYRQYIIKTFRVSGFDPLTYVILTEWNNTYNVYRHPILTFMMYPLYLINQALMSLTGINCAIFLTALAFGLCAFYAFLFLRRIFTDVFELAAFDASLLTLFFFSMGYVMVSCLVPDHFVISLMLLVIGLYATGLAIKRGGHIKTWKVVLYFLLTAGVTLNNGLKIFLCDLFMRGKRFFRPLHLVLGVIIPAVLIWYAAEAHDYFIVQPRVMALQKAKKEKERAEARAKQLKAEELAKAAAAADSAKALAAGGQKVDTAKTDTAKAKPAPRKVKRKKAPRWGKPIKDQGFWKWTDITSSRPDAIVENLFGESIQLHQDYLLQDALVNRPMVVRYNWALNYVVEAVVVALFLAGIWFGRRKRLLWLALSCFGLDFLLHIVVGFAINEVYINTAHWAYCIPIAIACIFTALRDKRRWFLWLRGLMVVLTLYLLIYNLTLVTSFFCF